MQVLCFRHHSDFGLNVVSLKFYLDSPIHLCPNYTCLGEAEELERPLKLPRERSLVHRALEPRTFWRAFDDIFIEK